MIILDSLREVNGEARYWAAELELLVTVPEDTLLVVRFHVI